MGSLCLNPTRLGRGLDAGLRRGFAFRRPSPQGASIQL